MRVNVRDYKPKTFTQQATMNANVRAVRVGPHHTRTCQTFIQPTNERAKINETLTFIAIVVLSVFKKQNSV